MFRMKTLQLCIINMNVQSLKGESLKKTRLHERTEWDSLIRGNELQSERTSCPIRGTELLIRGNELLIRENGLHNSI